MSDWQYTEPIANGSFFRIKHTEAPNGGLFAIAQCEVDAEGKLSLIDSQILAVEKPIIDVIKLLKPECFSERRIAIKKLPRQPSLQDELRRLILPVFLQPTDSEEIRIVSRSKWSIEIEVSDVVEPSVTVDLTPINSKLDAISTKIDSLQQSSGGTGTTRPTDLNPLVYIASALENYTYHQNYYTLDKINDGDNTSGVMKTSGGTANQLKVLVTFNTPKTINKITLHLGQFNGYYNAPTELKVYAGNSDGGNLLLTNSFTSESLIYIDTLSNSSFAQPLSEYTFVFTNSINNNVSINELDLFGA